MYVHFSGVRHDALHDGHQNHGDPQNRGGHQNHDDQNHDDRIHDGRQINVRHDVQIRGVHLQQQLSGVVAPPVVRVRVVGVRTDRMAGQVVPGDRDLFRMLGAVVHKD